jgi:hypothetical protein
MTRTMFLLSACVLWSASSPAATWSGTLVNADCYRSLQRNVNPDDTEPSADTDVNSDIRYCAPSLKTRHFAVIDSVGEVFELDDAADSRAAALVRSAQKQKRIHVTVTGQLSGQRLHADTISTF